MTDTVTTGGKAPLGVGSIISESFSILFANFVKVLMIAFIPTVVGLLISGAILGFGVALGIEGPAAALDPTDLGGFFAGIAVAAVIQMVIYGLVIALMVQLAYDAIVGRPVKLVEYFGPALRAALPIAVLTFVATILYGIGFALLIVPGLWLYAVFSVTAPAVVIDKVGFGGLGRAARGGMDWHHQHGGVVVLVHRLCAAKRGLCQSLGAGGTDPECARLHPVFPGADFTVGIRRDGSAGRLDPDAGFGDLSAAQACRPVT